MNDAVLGQQNGLGGTFISVLKQTKQRSSQTLSQDHDQDTSEKHGCFSWVPEKMSKID